MSTVHDHQHHRRNPAPVGRSAPFSSRKSKQNAIKAMMLTGWHGRMLYCGATRPGSCADITQARHSVLVDLLRHGPRTAILADAGY
ncbi:transposase family protein [Saccharopolyspora pogona]|uniref:transposase family protein n=1 Tax=Saccharopolyspora pogona TaxID=333966 RepID=UPI001682BF5D